MRLLWTLGKVLLALVLIVPVAMIALVTMLGLLGAVLGLTILAIKLAIISLIGWGAFRHCAQGALRLILAESARGHARAVAAERPALRSGHA